MPQMYPLNWLFLFNMFLILFMMFMIKMYFSFIQKTPMINMKNIKKIKLNWKW